MIGINKCCLVIIDVQGKLAQLMHDSESLLGNMEILVKGCRILEVPPLWCEQHPSALGPTTPRIAELLTDCLPIEKMSFSCCGDEKFVHALGALGGLGVGRKHVILCGIEAHVCVYQTAMDLLDMDYEVTVITDAVSSRVEANKQIALARMETEGVNLSSTEMVLFELLRTAGHDKFRQVTGLIR